MESLSQTNKIIIRTRDVCNSRPRIIGTRLEVYNVVSDLYSNTMSLKEYAQEREVSLPILLEALNYCRNLECQKTTDPSDKFCSGCILSTLNENYDFKKNDMIKIDDGIYKDMIKDYIGLGEKDELKEEEFGRPGWIMASKINM